jgi:hypothetical protein
MDNRFDACEPRSVVNVAHYGGIGGNEAALYADTKLKQAISSVQASDDHNKCLRAHWKRLTGLKIAVRNLTLAEPGSNAIWMCI